MRINHNNEPATTLQMMHRLALVSAADGLRFLLCNCCFFFSIFTKLKGTSDLSLHLFQVVPCQKMSRHQPVVQGYPRQFQKKGRASNERQLSVRVCVCVGGVTFEVCNSGPGLLCCGAGKSPYFTGHIFCHLEGEDSDSEQSFLRCT